MIGGVNPVVPPEIVAGLSRLNSHARAGGFGRRAICARCWDSDDPWPKAPPERCLTPALAAWRAHPARAGGPRWREDRDD